MKRSLAKKYILALIGFAILVFLDQWTKQLAVSHLMDQGNIILIPGVLTLSRKIREQPFPLWRIRQSSFCHHYADLMCSDDLSFYQIAG